MSHAVAFLIGAAVAGLGLILLEHWASERERQFAMPRGDAS